MSTKNLARTVIEGGRTGESKWTRRSSAQDWRAENRRFCRALTNDPDRWDCATAPVRHIEWVDFIHADRTNPCERFLIARAGRPWDAVRSEICRRFDRRKLAGKHVTDDHLLDRVERNYRHLAAVAYNARRHEQPKFWVDAHGILRHNPKARY